MNTPPACKNCGRTHANRGNPVILKVRGDKRGLCPSCVQTLKRKLGPEPEPRGVESDTRALEYWLNTVYRRRRRVNVPLSPQHPKTHHNHPPSQKLAPQKGTQQCLRGRTSPYARGTRKSPTHRP